jgi:hypothetical protein
MCLYVYIIIMCLHVPYASVRIQSYDFGSLIKSKAVRLHATRHITERRYRPAHQIEVNRQLQAPATVPMNNPLVLTEQEDVRATDPAWKGLIKI